MIRALEDRRDDIFAFIICSCAILSTGLFVRASIQGAVREPTQQAAQAKDQATKATATAAKAEHNVKQVTRQVQQSSVDAQVAVAVAKAAATQVTVHNAKECGKQINKTNAAVAQHTADLYDLKQQVVELTREVRILEGR